MNITHDNDEKFKKKEPDLKDELLSFLDWVPNNLTDLFEIMDEPDKVVTNYLKYKNENK